MVRIVARAMVSPVARVHLTYFARMWLTVLLLALAAFLLFRDYARDKGQHTAAKVVHAAVIALFIWLHTYTLQQIAWLVDFIVAHRPDDLVFIGGVPGWLRMVINEVLHLLLLLAAFAMVRRARWAVRAFRVLLLVSVPVKVIFFHDNHLEASGTAPGWVMMGLWMLTITTIFGGIALLYGTRFMRAFFNSPAGDALLTEPKRGPTTSL